MQDYLYSKLNKKNKKRKKRIWLYLILLIVGGTLFLLFAKTSFTINQISEESNTEDDIKGHIDSSLPKDDPDRLNVLLLGMRGLNDPGEGKLLTDAIVIASIKKSTGQTALISLPRDLYIQLWCSPDKRKINFAYFKGGLSCAKKTISHIIGLHIDYSVAVNFKGLEGIVDALGGIDIYRNTAFTESVQWAKEGKPNNKHWFIKKFSVASSSSPAISTTTSITASTTDGLLITDKENNKASSTEKRWVFYVPAGSSHLDGETALYYVRSRYTSNDFERMKRQQEVLLSIKEKALSLNVLANPMKIYNLLDVLGNNLKTDIKLTKIKSLIDLSHKIDKKDIKTKSFDIESDGLLYDTFIDEQYVLLPEGDNFDKIRKVCKNIFKNNN